MGQGKYSTAAARWEGVGPYYAMFPIAFADKVIEDFTELGDRVLDPFAGRATSVFSAATKGRVATGIEINPVGWIYGQTKLAPASETSVRKRVWDIAHSIDEQIKVEVADLPEFFSHCFSQSVLEYLVAAKNHLNWKKSSVDRTLMAFILIHLHGRRSSSLSNQMRQSKAMSPEYSIRWWQDRNLTPPEVDPVIFLLKRMDWRYKKGTPENTDSQIMLGDSRTWLKRLCNRKAKDEQKPYKLLLTSPPYHSVTNYFVDQWLRLWMLGYSERPTKSGEKYKQNGFESKSAYKELLSSIFGEAVNLMSSEGVVYIRTDARKYTFETTLEVLETAFPNWSFEISDRPYEKETQTALFGDKEKKPGERDIVLIGPRRNKLLS